MQSTSGFSIAAITRSVISLARDPKGGVDAGDDPVESLEQVVGVVERAVGADVDLRAGEQAKAVASSPRCRRATSSIRSASRSAVTWLPNPWLAEWSVIAR